MKPLKEDNLSHQRLCVHCSEFHCNLFSLLSFQTYGFTKLTANSTTLVWEYIHNDDNKVYDRLVLTKSDGSGSIAKEDDDNRDDDDNKDDKDDDKDRDDDRDVDRDDDRDDDDPKMGMAPNEL